MIATCEAALWVSFDALFSPPFTGRGDNYRSRYIAPYERHMHHRRVRSPVPASLQGPVRGPRHHGRELGFYGKRLANLDTVIVPMVGAQYPCPRD